MAYEAIMLYHLHKPSYFLGKFTTLSKILCKWKQDSVIISFLYLDSLVSTKKS